MASLQAGFRAVPKHLALFVAVAVATAGMVAVSEAPAQASTPTVLPTNAAEDVSVISIEICPNLSYDFWAPVPGAETPVEGAPNESRYALYEWEGEVFEDSVSRGTFSTSTSTDDLAHGLRFISSASGELTGAALAGGDSLSVSLTATGTSPNTTFGDTLPAADDGSTLTLSVSVLAPPAGAGTPADPYRVTSVDDLNYMRCASSSYFSLQNDIDMAPATHGVWLPVRDFRGVLDGNGHVISNFRSPELTGYDVGFFSEIKHTAQVVNITFRGARVSATAQTVGVLAGEIQDGLVKNVTIDSSRVEGSEEVGLVAGVVGNSSILTHMSVAGEVSTPNVWTRSYLAQTNPCILGPTCSGAVPERTFQMPTFDNRFEGPRLFSFGGFMGETGSSRTLVSHINLDASIVVPNREKPEGAGPQYVTVNAIAGFVGDVSDPNAVFSFITSSAQLDVLVDGGARDWSWGSATDIGGFVGETDDASYSDIDSTAIINFGIQSDISTPSEQAMTTSGGFVGDASDSQFTRIRSTAAFTIEVLDNQEGYAINEVGGFGGEFDRGTISSVSSSSTFDIDLPGGNIERMGGLLGEDNGDTMMTDVFVESSFAIDVAGTSPSVTDIAGLNGRSENELAGNSIIVAADFSFEGVSSAGDTPTLTYFDPVIGFMESESDTGSLVCTYYDSTLNPSPLDTFYFIDNVSDSGFPAGVGATTSQLQSTAFLDDCFDFDNSWLAVSGDYPTPRQSAFLTSEYDRSIDGVTLAPRPISSTDGAVTSGGSKALAATGLSLGWTAFIAGMMFILGALVFTRRRISSAVTAGEKP